MRRNLQKPINSNFSYNDVMVRSSDISQKPVDNVQVNLTYFAWWKTTIYINSFQVELEARFLNVSTE